MTNEPKAGDGLDPEVLAAYLDKRLPPDERAAVEAKLATDPDSYELLVELVHANEALKDEASKDDEAKAPVERPNEQGVVVPRERNPRFRAAVTQPLMADAFGVVAGAIGTGHGAFFGTGCAPNQHRQQRGQT